MKRETKFRGYCLELEKWVYGYLLSEDKIGEMTGESYTYWNVSKESVGQFTGLTSRNVKEIYDGDIIRYVKHIYLIKWDDRMCAWVVMYPAKDVIFRHGFWINNLKKNILIIGNIYQNPELLK